MDSLRLRAKKITAQNQESIDAFYKQHGPCCAGCDWWRWYNTVVGECIRTAPVSGEERWSMVGVKSCSFPKDAGHIMTPREHLCGEFKDEEQLLGGDK